VLRPWQREIIEAWYRTESDRRIVRDLTASALFWPAAGYLKVCSREKIDPAVAPEMAVGLASIEASEVVYDFSGAGVISA
jgi:hypothetical protein